ncbi:MAG: 6-bladed beta-propeller [Acidobacteriota bacterium]|nr:6-bladed beta-propeller [Acidobacteriota bacterium]
MFLLLFTLAFGDQIENGRTPAVNIPLEMTQIYQLGGVEDEELALGGGVELIADTSGDLIVTDSDNTRVLIFNRDGSLKTQFGRKGQGPGEFQGSLVPSLDEKDNIVIFDTIAKRLSRFDREGKLLNDLTFEPGIQAVITPVFMSNGKIALSAVRSESTGQLSNIVAVYDSEMKKLVDIQGVKQPPLDWSLMNQPDFWVDFLVCQFNSFVQGFPVVAAVGKDHFVVMRTNLYRGDIYDRDGKVVGSFSKKHKPKACSEEARTAVFEDMWESMSANPFLAQFLTKPVFEKAVSKAMSTDTLFPVFFLLRLGDGFAVVTNYDSARRQGDIDIFDAKGRYMGIAPYKGPMKNASGAGERIYISGLDEEDEVVIRCMQIEGLERLAAR